MNTKPSYLLDIPAEEYHDATKRNEYTTSHRLHLFRRCPALYHKHITGEIVEADTAAFILGRATHTLVVEGAEKFEREYLVSDGPTNPKTGKPYGSTTKAFLDWAADQPLPVISGADHEVMLKMANAVRAHEMAASLLSRGFAEQTVRTTWNGENVQARFDWYDPERNLLVDLKTCADLDRFTYDVRDFGYVPQLSFYKRCLELAAGWDDGKAPTEFTAWLIAVEKREPYRVGVFQVCAATLDDGNFAGPGAKYGVGNDPLIAELQACRRDDIWPTRFEGFGLI